jgi:hypothetical protein
MLKENLFKVAVIQLEGAEPLLRYDLLHLVLIST